ncbi:MAG: nucleotide pyrophosphohydrolase [Oligoflexia bacterium]|nr:nucleotide pyrophosphohydrolase [Oligoflexia bacterium]
MPNKIQNSDQNNTIENLKNRVAQFCEKRNWDKEHKPKELAIGAVTEASELLEIFRFLSEEECFKATINPKTRQKISEELADTLCFLLRFAQLYHFDLTSCLKDKLAKNAIKYPSAEVP